MPTKLSETQRQLVQRLREGDGVIERRQGGFWTAPGVPQNDHGVPAWSFGTQTVDALVRSGVLAAVEVHPRGFMIVARLTEPKGA